MGHGMASMTRRAFVGAVTGLAALASVLSGAATAGSAPVRHGVVEIGSSGVKASAWTVDWDSGGMPELGNVKVLEPRDVTTIVEGAVNDAAAAVDAMIGGLVRTADVPLENVHVYASSAVKKLPHATALALKVNEVSRKRIDLLSEEREAQIVFLQTVIYNNRIGQVVSIDIGSGNTKFAYAESRGGERVISTFELPYGTKSFAKKVDEERGDQPFAETAARLKREILIPALRDAISRRPGIKNLNRVYMSGGIVFATSTLLRPEGSVINSKDSNPYHQLITSKDFDTLYRRASQTPETLFDVKIGHIADPQVREAVGGNVRRIKTSIFTPEQIVAGLEIARAIASESGMEKKTVFFAKDGMVGLMRGYLVSEVLK